MYLCQHISPTLQQQRGGGVAMALAREVKQWTIAFEARVCADVLQGGAEGRHVVVASGGGGGGGGGEERGGGCRHWKAR